ncbi:sensor histidine kinase [Kineococcus arenarius]|uniref:sensor histidine kinase n=1 Tax=unclassified Kineococcus TaxID=2621656 RepID=UPI003D7DD84E
MRALPARAVGILRGVFIAAGLGGALMSITGEGAASATEPLLPVVAVLLLSAGMVVLVSSLVPALVRGRLSGRRDLAAVLGLVVGANAPLHWFGTGWLTWLCVLAVVLLGTLPTRAATVVLIAVLANGAAAHLLLAGTEELLSTMISGVLSAIFLNFLVVGVRTSLELHRVRLELARSEVNQERLRMARDLHDLMSRNVAALSLTAEVAQRHLRKGDGERAQAGLEQVHALTLDAAADLRALITGYRRLSLRDELDASCRLLTDAGVRVELVGGPPPGLAQEVDVIAAWCVREGVTNVLKHARATWCRCEVGLVDGELHLTMTNDGARPEPERRPHGSGGAGLLGVVERVGTLGGTSAATRGPDGTYVLTVRLPQHPPTADDATDHATNHATDHAANHPVDGARRDEDPGDDRELSA